MRRDSDVGSKDVDKDTTRTGSTHTDSDLEKNEVFEHEMSGALDGTDAGHESIPIRVLDHETNANESVANAPIGALQTTIATQTKAKRHSKTPSTFERTQSVATDTSKSHESESRKASTGSVRPRKKDRLRREKIPEQNLNNRIVGWEGQNDPEMPLNFPPMRKWLLLGLIASMAFLAPLASSMLAPAVSFMDAEFNNTNTILSALSVSIFVLGFAVGPLFLSPLCEIYGRRFVLTGANFFFALWQIGCATAPNLASLIVFRFFAGVGGSGCLAVGGGVIADIFRRDQRGLATSIYSIGPLIGPVVGPIAGGFLAERVGWRWVFWVLLIASTLLAVAIEFLNRETYPRILIQRKVARLSKELNRDDLTSCYEARRGRARESSRVILQNGMFRPLKLLVLSPIIFILSLYMALVYGLLYLFFTTIPQVFHNNYGWDPELTGLAYLGIGLGFIVGLLSVAFTSDKTVVRMTRANGGVSVPEMRLPACGLFACFIPVSFFWYGWSAHFKVHWIVPIIGLFPFGFGMMGLYIPIQAYMIDAFPAVAASAVAAVTVSRSLFGAFLPLAGPKLFETLGIGWGNSLLGFIAVALLPAPFIIYKFGERIRKARPMKV